MKQGNVGAKHGEIMEIIGKMYRESKMERDQDKQELDKPKHPTKFDSLVREMEIVVIDDD